jgi:hypothetical protein
LQAPTRGLLGDPVACYDEALADRKVLACCEWCRRDAPRQRFGELEQGNVSRLAAGERGLEVEQRMALDTGDAVWLAAARGASLKHAIAFIRRDAMSSREDEILGDCRTGAAGAVPADDHDHVAGQRLVSRSSATDQAGRGRHERKQNDEEGERADHGVDPDADPGATTGEPSLPAACTIQSR